MTATKLEVTNWSANKKKPSHLVATFSQQLHTYIQKQYNLRVKSSDLVEKASLWNFSHEQLHDDDQLLHHVGKAECIPLRR